MNAKDLRIVFMGTPEFAVPSLRALVAGGKPQNRLGKRKEIRLPDRT